MSTAKILDGRLMAVHITKELQEAIKANQGNRAPGLATVLVGHDPASLVYVGSKRKRAAEIGIVSSHIELSERVLESELLEIVKGLNHDPLVDGILVQLPLPAHINQQKIIEAIDPKKDVDGFHPLNLGHLLREHPQVVPCTPRACLHLIKETGLPLLGAHAVVVGRSNIVGKPLAHLLLRENATVTIAHSHTRNLAEITKQADVLISAAGKADLITKAHVKPGAVVIDVGINRLADHRLVGDVAFDEVAKVASYITPVPGGVGPLTIAMLMKNTWDLYKKEYY